MRRLPALVLVASLLAATGASASAQSLGRQPGMATQAFRLHVAGRIAPGATFWVAYGPVDGHFAILRLRPVGRGMFVRQSSLPIGARTTYSYVMGHGTIHAKFGQAPGNPVVTIRTVGPITVQQAPLATVQWHAPIG